jgi:hypothetical protein
VLVGKHRNRTFPQLSQLEKSQQRQRNEREHYSLPALPVVVVTTVFAERKQASPGYQRYLDLDSAVHLQLTLSSYWHTVIHHAISIERKTSWLLAGLPFSVWTMSSYAVKVRSCHTHSTNRVKVSSWSFKSYPSDRRWN